MVGASVDALADLWNEEMTWEADRMEPWPLKEQVHHWGMELDEQVVVPRSAFSSFNLLPAVAIPGQKSLRGF